jgi:PGF-pre-PGF domain-containing protein
VNVGSTEIGIKLIELDVSNPANSVKITVEKLSGQPASITREITGQVYQYLQITHENLATVLANARLKFNVTKQWLSDNGAAKEDVLLARYGADWEDLPTSLLSESSTEVEYEAQTAQFSTFAIVARAQAPTTAPTTVAPGQTTSAPTTTIAPAGGGEQANFSEIVTILISVIIVAASIFALYYYEKSKKHGYVRRI